jgi:hypothetical protein
MDRSDAFARPFPWVVCPTLKKTGGLDSFAQSLRHYPEWTYQVNVDFGDIGFRELSQYVYCSFTFGFAPLVVCSSADHVDPVRWSQHVADSGMIFRLGMNHQVRVPTAASSTMALC